MRILQINSHYNQGGAARIVACIHEELLKQGEDSFVAYGRGRKKNEQDERLYRFDATLEVCLSALFSRWIGLNGWSNQLATKRLIRYIQEKNPDIIHMHVLHGYYLNLPLFFRFINANHYPCVWTFHDCHAFVGNCGYFFDCVKWQEGCGNCPYLRSYPTSYIFDYTGYMWKKKQQMFTKGGDKIIVSPSDWLTDEAKKSFFKKYPCVTIHNGINTEAIFFPRNKKECRKKYGYGQADKIALGIAVGYDDPRKGVKYILETADALANEIKVILIGWEKRDNKRLKELTNVSVLPATDNLDMLAEYYSLADVFMLPSLAENYATVALEAMACGTPVVGFATGGIPEQLTGRKGIVVPLGNQEAFTQAVREAVQGECNLLSENELADVIKQENSISQMTLQYIDLYHQLLLRS